MGVQQLLMALATSNSLASASVKFWGDNGYAIRLIITLFVSPVPFILRLDFSSVVDNYFWF